MIDEHHDLTRAEIAAVMHSWGYNGIPDGMVRDIIRALNRYAPAPVDLLRRIADA